jgi:outer membrane lipoprotein LolB
VIRQLPQALQLTLRWVLVIAIFSIAGCAHTTRASAPLAPDEVRWQGRLALTVRGEPPQAFSADFELVGAPRAGELTFYSPLGSTVARLQWDADGAELRSAGETRHFDSLDALTLHTTGAVLPVASLFAWLRGEPIDTPGWQVDLQRLGDGRLQAQRYAPEPVADLRIVLER